MSSREEILRKLRSAKPVGNRQLAIGDDSEMSGAGRDVSHASHGSPAAMPDIVTDEKIYSDYKTDTGEMLTQFIERQENLHGEVLICESIEQMVQKLANVLKDFDPASAKYFKTDLLEQIFDLQPEIKKYFDLKTDLSISSPDFSKYEAGVSGAEYLIARTGSIFINSRIAGGRRLTVLPPVHIVLAKRSHLVSSLDDVLKKIKQNDSDWSFATFITGPSRTSDIEKKLVLGAHGPKRLVTLILNS
jgi:L-lactate dehydrogenase complex protein LldG